ncbi:hypothetical protein JEQ12_019209 [Ovis aries]|uniref:Uncharacterized protein n=1 Tax=Ovis aries TaxID=9940 RepID=A0A836D0B9_SHEEP|nr:hypothetical protein JEQ12_019209 [Ovis aries]
MWGPSTSDVEASSYPENLLSYARSSQRGILQNAVITQRTRNTPKSGHKSDCDLVPIQLQTTKGYFCLVFAGLRKAGTLLRSQAIQDSSEECKLRNNRANVSLIAEFPESNT